MCFLKKSCVVIVGWSVVVVVVIRDVIINVIVIIDSVIVGRDSKDETSTNTRKGLRDERERRDVRL